MRAIGVQDTSTLAPSGTDVGDLARHSGTDTGDISAPSGVDTGDIEKPTGTDTALAHHRQIHGEILGHRQHHRYR